MLKNECGEESSQFAPGEDLEVEISYEAQKRIERPIFSIAVIGKNGTCFTSNMQLDGHRPDVLEGPGEISCTFRSIPLLPQTYTVRLGIRSANVADFIVSNSEVGGFNVVGDLADYGFRGDYVTYAPYSTPVVVPYEWRLPNGTRASVSLNRQPVCLPESNVR